MGNQSLLLSRISEYTASACYSSKEQVQLKHGTQTAATWQPKLWAVPQYPSVQWSTSITGVGWTIERYKKVFSCWHPCQAVTVLESGWNLSQYYRGISIRESYAILTTKTSESITNLPKLHNALSPQTSLPLYLHKCLSANSQVSQPLWLQQRLHHTSCDQHSSGFEPAALTITKF